MVGLCCITRAKFFYTFSLILTNLSKEDFLVLILQIRNQAERSEKLIGGAGIGAKVCLSSELNHSTGPRTPRKIQ